MSPRNLLVEWSRLLVAGLVNGGVRQVVLSPGSRSAPFALAAAEHPDLAITTIVDERSAAFFALGYGRATAQPALLLCTSGTAPAHYAPAVIEANLSHTPLLVLSADRPFEAVDCGAAQTIDQLQLFGHQVRGFFELGIPEAHEEALRGVLRRAGQAAARALAPVPGPVHLNARARKPLEPPSREETGGTAERALAETAAALRRRGGRLFPQRVIASAEGIARIAASLARARRPLVVAGALAPAAAAALAARLLPLVERWGAVLAPDLASGLRAPLAGTLSALTPVLDVAALREHAAGAALRPDVVLQLGPPLAAGWPSFVRRLTAGTPAAEFFVLGGHGAFDPGGDAAAVVLGELDDALERLGAAVSAPRVDAGWRDEWLALDRGVRAILDRQLEQLAQPGEATAVRAVTRALRPGDLLALGNSLPIRLAETFCAGAAGVSLFTQRGANGIDGLVSQFAGCVAALAGSARSPGLAVLVLGDLSLLHDTGGLAALAQLPPARARIVVLNNQGGRIFEQLPVASALDGDPRAMELFTTPQPVDWCGAARLFGLAYQRADTEVELIEALRRTAEPGRSCLVEIAVPPHQTAEEGRRVAAALERWASASLVLPQP